MPEREITQKGVINTRTGEVYITMDPRFHFEEYEEKSEPDIPAPLARRSVTRPDSDMGGIRIHLPDSILDAKPGETITTGDRHSRVRITRQPSLNFQNGIISEDPLQNGHRIHNDQFEYDELQNWEYEVAHAGQQQEPVEIGSRYKAMAQKLKEAIRNMDVKRGRGRPKGSKNKPKI